MGPPKLFIILSKYKENEKSGKRKKNGWCDPKLLDETQSFHTEECHVGPSLTMYYYEYKIWDNEFEVLDTTQQKIESIIF